MGLESQCLLISDATTVGCHASGRLVPFAPRFPLPQRLSRQSRRVVSYAVDSQNGATLEKDNTELPLVKMFIAGPDGGRPISVPSARAAKPVAPVLQQRSNGSEALAAADPLAAPDSVLAAAASSSDRALRGELSVVSDEVNKLDAQLARSERQIRLRDQQIQELRSELATKDLRLSAARAELLESHMQLQAREIELHEAYAKLTAGAMERGKMRTQLINTELELEEVRLQLQEWNDNLQQQMRALRASGRDDEATALTEALSEAAVDPNASWGVIKAAKRADVDILGGKGSTNGMSSDVATDRPTATMPASSGADADKPFLGGALRFVQNLHELSVKLVQDADGDRRNFGKSAAAKKVKRAAS